MGTEPGIFLTELVRRTPFQVSHQAMNAKLWVHFTKEMHVVGHTCTARTPALAGGARECRCGLQLDHGCMESLSGLSDDLFQTHVHTDDQYLSAIFWTSDNGILARIGHIAVVFEVMLIVRTYVLILRHPLKSYKFTIRCTAPPAFYPHG
jgi:hypothetical protein